MAELRKRGAQQQDASAQPADAKPRKWGRDYSGDWAHFFPTFGLMFGAPLFVLYCFVTIDTYNGSMLASGTDLYNFIKNGADFKNADMSWFPYITKEAVIVYFIWFFWQIFLTVFVPAPKEHGQPTPAGHLLEYTLNGWRAWWITMITFFTLSLGFNLFKPTIVYDNFRGAFWVKNLTGFALTFFSYIKARFFPSHPDDCKYSGSIIYDIFMGVELNPRFGNFDFKLHFNARPGIIFWSLMAFSFAFKQIELYGEVSNSMVAVMILYNIYILDYFWNEGWYLRTIDIAHDHFGMYLAWGDTTWLPYLYTLHPQYLVKNPVHLSQPAFYGILALGVAGYFIFRSVNDQKDKFRKNPDAPIWGKKPKYIKAPYMAGDKEKVGTLLMSGWWGISRHFNYVGDLMMSLSYCLTCGFDHLIPYFYIIYMTILLVHRTLRDEQRCRNKYGEKWDEYCKNVPYRILPFIF